MSDLLAAFARRAADDPFYLAYLLAEVARGDRLDDAGLAAALGCRPEEVDAVRCCRAPRDDTVGFREDVARIAERFGLDRVRLAQAVRRGRVLRHMREGAAGGAALLAARDAPPPEGPRP
jgi:hypothetical protein